MVAQSRHLRERRLILSPGPTDMTRGEGSTGPQRSSRLGCPLAQFAEHDNVGNLISS
jgi:hypothetical protein